jgi:DNA polymerase
MGLRTGYQRHIDPWKIAHPATGCDACPALVAERSRIVWSKGPVDAPIMVIAEAPGETEDTEGKPFVGRSGRQLDKLFTEVGIPADQVHYANVVMCRPPNNRDPLPDELENCYPWLIEHLRRVDPDGVILLGRFAVDFRFSKFQIKDTRGLLIREECDGCGQLVTQCTDEFASGGKMSADPFRFCESGEYHRTRLYLSTYHPASIFRQPANEAAIVADLKRFKESL